MEANAVQVTTTGAEVAGLVTGEQVRELPLNGRNFLQLGTLMPGVSQGDGFNTKDRGLMSGIELAVSGSSLGGNMWTVDGANNNDVGSNRTILVFPFGGRHRRVQGPPEQLRRRVRRRRRRPGEHRHPRRHQRVPRQRLLLRPKRRPGLEGLLPGAGRPAQGPAEHPRLRLDVRRPDHQGQAPLLRVPGVEPGEARDHAHGLRAHRRRARGRFQRPADRRLLVSRPGRPADRGAVPRQPDSRRTGSAPRASSPCSSTRFPTRRRARAAATTG